MEKTKKTVIVAGYQCNNQCQFCINSQKRDFPMKDSALIKKEMMSARKRGNNFLELIGGETTIRPDILDLISFAKKLGFERITMATNGRMLSYFEFSKNIIKAGLNSVIFSIHGHNARLHDYLTGVPGSFKQLLGGIHNFKKLNFKGVMGTNTTIVKQNYKYLPQIGKFVYNFGFNNSEFIFVDPSSGAPHQYFNKFVPKISKAARYIRKCLDLGEKYKIVEKREPYCYNNNWSVRYVPLCYFQEYYPDQISESREVEIYKNVEHLAPDYQDFNATKGRREIGRIKTKKCQECKLYSKCEGIWREYIKNYGDKELKPIQKK
ncbi:MAG: radical SAM protein [Candidatus Pacebacteria bacterium]|nr:radical SAM protein [Candidatus Paceibacterota bacterium]